jgi:predicted CopG family antitoxin
MVFEVQMGISRKSGEESISKVILRITARSEVNFDAWCLVNMIF